ncbi:MAG: chemotaxis response regulator protein-glutamate methylesterase, partial [Deltaproteobacteria bacterium]
DDSALYRRLLSEALTSDPGIEIAGTASSGKIALARIPQINPDVVTLDVEMPEMDGLETLSAIRALYPKLPVIMFSSLTERAAPATVDALLRGATDYAVKPSSGDGMARVREELVPKILKLGQKTATAAAAPATRAARSSVSPPARITLAPSRRPPRRVDVLAIGISTGGPNALAELFKELPGDLGVPVLIVQHMPAQFTGPLAGRLSSLSDLSVHEAVGGEAVAPGHVYIAPGNYHLTVYSENRVPRLRLDQNEPENSCRPAVDPLFRSVSEVYGAGALALVMTGMGQDGLRGIEHISECGGVVWAQDEASSVVWGMPGFVARSGLAQAVIPLDRLAFELTRHIREGRDTRGASSRPEIR